MRSPTATSMGTRLPLSSRRPLPTAVTSPCCGFSFAVSGITRPLAVTSSCLSGVMTMRSARGTSLVLAADLAGAVFVGMYLKSPPGNVQVLSEQRDVSTLLLRVLEGAYRDSHITQNRPGGGPLYDRSTDADRPLLHTRSAGERQRDRNQGGVPAAGEG